MSIIQPIKLFILAMLGPLYCSASTNYIPVSIDPNNIKEQWHWNGFVWATFHPLALGEKNLFLFQSGPGYPILLALSLAEGRQAWTKEYDVDHVLPPLYDAGQVVVQTDEGSQGNSTALELLDEDSGRTLHKTSRKNNQDAYSASTITKHILYTCGSSGTAFAYNLTNHTELWHHEEDAPLQIHGVPAATDFYLLYPTANEFLKSDKEQGKVLSRFPVPSGYSSWGTAPVPDGNDAVFYIKLNTLMRFNLQTDSLDYAIPDISSNISVEEHFVYALQNQQLIALDKKTGEPVWQLMLDAHFTSGTLVTAQNLIFVSTKGKTQAFSKDKKHALLWEVSLGGTLYLSKDKLFISDAKAGHLTLTAFSLT